MVTTENMALLRDWNFGARCLQGAPTSERIITELGRVRSCRRCPGDRSDSNASRNLEGCLDQYERLYEEVIAEGPAERPRTT